jgi:hypothetical protein
MRDEYRQLLNAYATEMRASKNKADEWWLDLQSKYTDESDRFGPKKLWPLRSASHPWVIATFRKYYLLCEELNQQLTKEQEKTKLERDAGSEEGSWGEREPADADNGTIEPKVFAYELFAGGETQDLYEYLQRLAFVPIGIKDEELV